MSTSVLCREMRKVCVCEQCQKCEIKCIRTFRMLCVSQYHNIPLHIAHCTFHARAFEREFDGKNWMSVEMERPVVCTVQFFWVDNGHLIVCSRPSPRKALLVSSFPIRFHVYCVYNKCVSSACRILQAHNGQQFFIRAMNVRVPIVPPSAIQWEFMGKCMKSWNAEAKR